VVLVSAPLEVIYWAGARVLRESGFDRDFSRAADVALFAGLFGASAAISAIVAVLAWDAWGSIRRRPTLACSVCSRLLARRWAAPATRVTRSLRFPLDQSAKRVQFVS
jgi:hypothetical protein